MSRISIDSESFPFQLTQTSANRFGSLDDFERYIVAWLEQAEPDDELRLTHVCLEWHDSVFEAICAAYLTEKTYRPCEGVWWIRN
ncbi:uncharacterized protein N7473_004855 [Penicillium subrubescens]|uniref:Uncharacterized protein n=1 Tax=Penicillium subrubescens TaxID=1316194 RepID=A0A1Q5T9M5_9EURO|nr:uncharacterized protein N7473_004855 [Penicillium subrubescens]KAJ5900785.1 hypothetical protein N7473_004855 [Penicillium subrubescens]OKO96858.1 hypothetical protein PENSUB_10412 [Penicillium subrubescens]